MLKPYKSGSFKGNVFMPLQQPTSLEGNIELFIC